MTGELFGKSLPTADPKGRFLTAIKNRQAVKGVVNGRTLNGDGSISLTFYDPTYSNFRIEQKVFDDNMKEGYVVESSPGAIRITPLNNPSVFSSEFAVNTEVRAVGKLGAIDNSTGTTSLYEDVDMQEDYLEVTRDTQQIPASQKTFRFAATVDGEKRIYGFKNAEMDMINRVAFYSVFKKFFGKGGYGMQGIEGQMNKTYGIRNRLIDGSGNYINSTTPITMANLEQLLGTCADNNPGFDQDIMMLPGRDGLRDLQKIPELQAALAFAGGKRDDKTVSISLDVREIVVSGITAKVATSFNMLNDTVNLPSWNKNSIYFINRSQITVDGMQRSLINPIHFSMSMSSDYTPQYRCVPGMVGISDTDSTGLPEIEGYQIAGSSVAGASVEYYDYSGISMVPLGHGLWEKR